MNKKLIVVGVIVIILLAVGGVMLGRNQSDSEPMANRSQQAMNSDSEKTTKPPKPASNDQSAAGKYVDYRDDVIASTSGTKILFFHAPWCPQCRALEADIEKNGVPSGVTIIKVDYDSAQQLRQKYGVTLQTTLVLVDDKGNGIKKYVAYDDPTLAAVTRNLL